MVRVQGPVSRKSRERFGPEKPLVKLRPAYSVKLIFSHVVKGIKIKIKAKFRALRRLRFEDTKRIMSPEIRPESFGTFEKRAPGPTDVKCKLYKAFLVPYFRFCSAVWHFCRARNRHKFDNSDLQIGVQGQLRVRI